jgi:cytochrome c nitrite reductase small subunit
MLRRYGIFGAIAATFMGVLVGVGAYTFHYAEGFSYFSTDPASCANCHVMWPQYDSWHKSSHHAVATCVDCHMPDTFPHNMIAKADNGWRHSWAFTFQNFHEPIQIIPRNERILENNCRRCHEAVVHSMLTHQPPRPGHPHDEISCIHCHAAVGHGPQR